MWFFRFLEEPDIETDYKKYMFQINTRPNGAIYEFTIVSEAGADLETTEESRRIQIEEGSISRINAYGNSAECIAEFYPDLRKFCFCKN